MAWAAKQLGRGRIADSVAISFDSTQTLAIAIAVLFAGSFVIARIGFLGENNIPIPVVGGILFAVLNAVFQRAGRRPGHRTGARAAPRRCRRAVAELFRAGFVSRETMRLGIGVPLHPAAARFYRQRGVPEL
jgi:hypothetical protein